MCCRPPMHYWAVEPHARPSGARAHGPRRERFASSTRFPPTLW